MNSLGEQIRDEIHHILQIVTEITELPSRWSGRVELVRDAGFRGRKPFSCDILIDEALAHEDLRWATLIHEAFHTVSAGYVATDYRTFRGWEEGVVEQLQRLFRQNILDRLGIAIDQAVFIPGEIIHQYNDYIEALERLRMALEEPEQQFYLGLLQTSIKDRPGFILSRRLYLSDDSLRYEFVQTFAACNAILKGFHQAGF